jgi:ABC-type antimicrobial peptide transport system permease subunit
MGYDWANYIALRIKPGIPIQDALASIKTVFKKYSPDGIFDYSLTDEEYAVKFAAEERIGNLASFFAILAVFISCLGLFGLASFVAEQRTKEIGMLTVSYQAIKAALLNPVRSLRAE